MTGGYRFAEWCMYNYKRNCELLGVMRVVLEVLDGGDVHGQRYSEAVSRPCGEHSDPVGRLYELRDKVERKMRHVLRCVEGVSRLREYLSEHGRTSPRCEQLGRILECRYMGGERGYCGMSERTYYRRKRELVMMCAVRLGVA